MNNMKSVLIIDDQIPDIAALTAILKSEYIVYSESNSKNGLAVTEKYMPDIILLDIVMPEMDGYEVITAIKNCEKTKNIPVIFISALNTRIDEELGLKLGAADYLVKPFSSSIVKLRVRSQIRYLNDLNNLKQAHEDKEYRAKLLFAVNSAASFLINSDIDSFDKALYQSMKVITESVNADRMYIWKNYGVEGKLHCKPLYEWPQGLESYQEEKIAQDIPYAEIIPRWEIKFSKGECINEIVCDMPIEEQELLKQQKIVSILAVPVFINDQFWGFAGFDDCCNERLFTEEEESILRSAGLFFANALLRNKMIINIRETSVQLETALEQATAASRVKSDFLSTMSHEIRTPMNEIIEMTSIGRNAIDLEQKNRAFKKIEDASSRLLGVINDVLDMAKIEANKPDLPFSG